MTTVHIGLGAGRAAELGVILTRLASLAGAIPAYRQPGQHETANLLHEEFVVLLDDLSDDQRAELLLLAIGRLAPRMILCDLCRRAHERRRPCPAVITCPTCGRSLPGLLSQCENPPCVALANQAEAAYVRREDV